MSFFSFGKNKSRSIALIDIGSASVGGAYAHFKEGEQPVIQYTARVLVEPRKEEDITTSMLRSLSVLEKLLTEEGAPALHRAVGNAHVQEVLASIAAPWQETSVSRVRIESERPSVFTHASLRHAFTQAAAIPEDRMESGRSVIATLLNGYETARPFGKRANRAELVTLYSTLARSAAGSIEASLRSTFHTGNISIVAFAPVAYAVLRDLYPHQKDFVVLHVSGTGTDAVFVKKGLIEGTCSIEHGMHSLMRAVERAGKGPHEGFAKASADAEEAWLQGLRGVFEPFACDQALPRTIFLLADTDAREYVKRALEKNTLRTLWLSDDPLAVIPVTPAQAAPRVATRGMGEADIFLSFLALHARSRDGASDVMPEHPSAAVR